MVHLRQPEGSALCGQACVAMAAGVSIDRAIEAVGHQKMRGTYVCEIRDALRSLGVMCADRLKRVRKGMIYPPRAMLWVTWNEKRNPKHHWILIWDGKPYDPAGRYPGDYERNCRITSYLEIFS